MTRKTGAGWQIGRRIAPPRFLIFLGLALVGVAGGNALWSWRIGTMAGFDAAALIFLLSTIPLLDNRPEEMRRAATDNEANRALLLAITGLVMVVILVSVASELTQKGSLKPFVVALVVATLALAWTFSNVIYALHYAHLFYTGNEDGKDIGGIDFPATEEPDYWDFIYFAFCLGMTFQVSDTDVTSSRIRRVVTAHCLAAFVFNIGILAFSINVLGGSGG